MWLEDRGQLGAQDRGVLEAQLAPLTSLQDVVRWAFSLRPPADVHEVVVQDEFSHDVVLRWRDGRWLAFDTT